MTTEGKGEFNRQKLQSYTRSIALFLLLLSYIGSLFLPETWIQNKTFAEKVVLTLGNLSVMGITFYFKGSGAPPVKSRPPESSSP